MEVVFIMRLNTVIILIFFNTADVYAASNGSLGVTSSGSASVSFTKNSLVKVSKLDDFNLNNTSTLGKGVWYDDICVFSTSGSYKITAYSQKGGASGYKMTSTDINKSINYAIDFSPDNTAVSGDSLVSGIASSVYANASDNSEGCSGGVNSRILLKVDENSLDFAEPGNYDDVLIFIVHPM